MLLRILILGLCTFTLSSITQATDTPILEITSAVYGVSADEEKVDVTEKVSKRIKDGQLRLEITNQLFSDPAPQKSKTLFVKYKLGSESLELKVSEGDMLLIPVPKLQGALKIKKAEYGDHDTGTVYDVTDDVRSRLKDGSIEMPVNNELLGDPASGVYKVLRVVYTIGDVELVKRVYEGGTLKLSEPKPEPVKTH